MSKKEILPGIHTVDSLLRWQPQRAHSIWLEQNKKNHRIEQLIAYAKKLGISIQQVQRVKLDQLCEGAQHQGIAASCSPTPLLDEHDLITQVSGAPTPPLILILDEISDPHNFGACLRTADAAGVAAVVIPQRNSAPFSPIVHKIASGATLRLTITKTTNLSRFIDAIKKSGVWVYGAAGEASKSVYQSNLTQASAIVMGAEGQGLRRLTQERCDELYSLPMLGGVESLNVSVATGIFLYEAVRQRGH
ncbi:MAG: 23S rRNA (guanosine(2251)-2'-O)-methyltransferase RlmB [Gammaproteobacteria bacterium]|nr:23S rRNA (guanosine(2251)-2'-O)-methyltransferase RlmB [Gammaproteobacteria bacterium]